jgi:hypothetical protein
MVEQNKIENINIEIDKFKLLYEKSSALIQEQLDDYKNIQVKTAMLISLSAIVFPLVFSVSNFESFKIGFLSTFLVPIGIYLWALVLFLQILYPVTLNPGFGMHALHKHYGKSMLDVLKKEIVMFQAAHKKNEKVIRHKNDMFKKSIVLTFLSIGLLCILIFIGRVLSTHEFSVFWL